MFRATHRPSSGAQNCNFSLWFYIRFWLPAAAIAEPSQRPSTINVCKTRGCSYSFELLMMGGVSPETCWAIKKHWNNQFYNTVASCWFFLWESFPGFKKSYGDITFRKPQYLCTIYLCFHVILPSPPCLLNIFLFCVFILTLYRHFFLPAVPKIPVRVFITDSFFITMLFNRSLEK
jgi:hypothetical protein